MCSSYLWLCDRPPQTQQCKQPLLLCSVTLWAGIWQCTARVSASWCLRCQLERHEWLRVTWRARSWSYLEASSHICLTPRLGWLKGGAKLGLWAGVSIHGFSILFCLPLSMVALEEVYFLPVSSAPRMSVPQTKQKLHGILWLRLRYHMASPLLRRHQYSIGQSSQKPGQI